MANLELYAEVAVPVPLARTFTYRVPQRLAGALRPGVRVCVPFGPRRLEGYCVGLADRSEVERVKDVESVLDDEPLLDAGQLELGRWIARTYCAGLGEVLDCMLPGAVRRKVAVSTRTEVGLAVSADDARKTLQAGRRSPKRQAVIDVLIEVGAPVVKADLLARAGCGGTVLKALHKQGLLSIRRVEVAPWEQGDPVVREEPPTPTIEQRRALEKIETAVSAGRFAAFLLFGVTGSGKTEVYLRAIEQVVASGRQAIVLVPEIALTPQAIERFRKRFDAVAVMHSGMGGGERHAYWRAIAHGRASVVVGARSAVFAPTRKLGLIVIDEEHEPSFKQANSPRYHARDVALRRARHDNIPVILGSATPSLESYAEVGRGRFDLLELTRRIQGRPMPKVQIIDMRTEMYARRGFRVLSRTLEQQVNASLGRGEQVMLYLNRRGFSTVLLCPRCGETLRCADCDITLTYHRGRDKALCHYCGGEVVVPEVCPECQSGPLRPMGLGTERVEHEIRTLFTKARIRRMDSDTMRRRGAYEEVIGDLRAGKIDILIGTQMIAKGHDFPDVTLVGVIGADTSLHLADFRARERTFQLLAQMAGRTGRGEKGGRVVVQTFCPDDFSIQFACKHDYLGFAPRELSDRKVDGYPPFSRLCRIVLEGPKLPDVRKRAQELAQGIRQTTGDDDGVKVLGPVACPISRIKGQYRLHLVLKAPEGYDFFEALTRARERLGGWRGVKVIVDVDPMSML